MNELPVNCSFKTHGARSRVLVISPQPFYEDRGTPIAVLNLLKALTELGFEVDLVTYPIGRDNPLPGVAVFRSANVFRFKHVPIGLSIRKVILDLSMVQTIRRRLRAEEYVSIHAVEEAAFIAFALGRTASCPLVYDMQSSLPEQLKKHALLRLAPAQRILCAIEKWLLDRVPAVVCSVGLKEYVQKVNPSVPVWEWYFPSLRERAEEAEVESLKRRLGITSDGPVILYSGTFEEYQGLHLLLDAIPKIVAEVPNSHFVLVGASRESDLTNVELDTGVQSRVLVLPQQPRTEIPAFLQMADLLISPRIHGKNLPLKIFDYLAAGKPIVATAIQAHRLILNASRAVLVEPTAESLADETVRLLSNPARMKQLGEASSTYAEENLTWLGFLQSIAEIHGVANGELPAA